MKDAIKNYLWRLLVSVDQFINVLISPIFNYLLQPDHLFGYPDETLSSVFGKNREKCRVCGWICWVLDELDTDHCDRNIEKDEGNSPENTKGS